MKKHTVFVAGKRFVLLSEDKEEYVEKVAQEVNDKIFAIASQNPTLDSRACAILCALDQADDKYKEVLKNQRFSERATEVMKQSDKHAKSVKELREELKKAKTLNEKQLHQIADNNVEIKNVSGKLKEANDENANLKEENKKLKEEFENLKKQLETQQNKEKAEKKVEEIVTEKVEEKTKKEIKKQPYQNPVAKVKQPAKVEKKANEEKSKLNQMSLFENE